MVLSVSASGGATGLDKRDGLAQGGEHILRGAKKDLTAGGERYRAGGTGKQALAEGLFQLTNLVTDSRGGDANFLGGQFENWRGGQRHQKRGSRQAVADDVISWMNLTHLWLKTMTLIASINKA